MSLTWRPARNKRRDNSAGRWTSRFGSVGNPESRRENVEDILEGRSGEVGPALTTQGALVTLGGSKPWPINFGLDLLERRVGHSSLVRVPSCNVVCAGIAEV
jgi:hypothetical protein